MGCRRGMESEMGNVRMDPGMAGWASRLDLEQLAERVEEMRQRLGDREQVLEVLQREERRGATSARPGEREETAADLATEVEHLRAQFESVAAVLEWEQARRRRERAANS